MRAGTSRFKQELATDLSGGFAMSRPGKIITLTIISNDDGKGLHEARELVADVASAFREGGDEARVEERDITCDNAAEDEE